MVKTQSSHYRGNRFRELRTKIPHTMQMKPKKKRKENIPNTLTMLYNYLNISLF